MYICQCYFSIFEIISKDFIIVIDNFLVLYLVKIFVILLCFCIILNKCFSLSYFSTN